MADTPATDPKPWDVGSDPEKVQRMLDAYARKYKANRSALRDYLGGFNKVEGSDIAKATSIFGTDISKNKGATTALLGFLSGLGGKFSPEEPKAAASDVYAERKNKEMQLKVDAAVKGMQKDYEGADTYKNYNEATQAYNQLVQLTQNATAKGFGDIAILTKFMKSIDPRSVVREQEYKTASETGNLWQRLENSVRGLLTGQKISDEQRDQILSAAKEAMDANTRYFKRWRDDKVGAYNNSLDLYRSIWADMNADTEKLFPNISGYVAAAPVSTQQTAKPAKDEKTSVYYKRAQQIVAEEKAKPGTYSKDDLDRANEILGGK